MNYIEDDSGAVRCRVVTMNVISFVLGVIGPVTVVGWLLLLH